MVSTVVGREATCSASYGGKSASGKALLETTEVVFRGEGLRFKVPFARVKSAIARDGVLELKLADGTARLTLGAQAATWARRIKNPPGRLDKLGVKPGMTVSLVGPVEDAFAGELRARVGELAEGRARAASDLIFFATTTPADLSRLATLKKNLQPAGALWVVRTKGPTAPVSESAVMAAGRAAGLVDTKVVAFSDTHTAERFVIPVARR
jgi:hypothetical protein